MRTDSCKVIPYVFQLNMYKMAGAEEKKVSVDAYDEDNIEVLKY